VPFTPEDIPDQHGRVAIVTGANSGIGYVTALELARHGAEVVLACRSMSRGEEAASRIAAALLAGGQQADTPPNLDLGLGLGPSRPTVIGLDLADLRSVAAFSREIRDRYDHLDLLVNNAGVMAVPVRKTTVDGFELQFGTNHLGHFALSAGLFPLLAKGRGGRIVTLSSLAHERGWIAFDDLQQERHYRPFAAYSQSKLANLLFSQELDRRLRLAGLPLLSLAAHPGFARTNLVAAGYSLGGHRSLARIGGGVAGLFGQSARRGALPSLYAATSSAAISGDYIGPTGPLGLYGSPGLARLSSRARDRAVAARLWSVSEALTGLAFSVE